MCFMDNEVGISADLSTRFNEPRSPIWYVVNIYNCVAMLLNFAVYYGVAINCFLFPTMQLDSSAGYRYTTTVK
jgi:hypothetical protein